MGFAIVCWTEGGARGGRGLVSRGALESLSSARQWDLLPTVDHTQTLKENSMTGSHRAVYPPGALTGDTQLVDPLAVLLCRQRGKGH